MLRRLAASWESQGERLLCGPYLSLYLHTGEVNCISYCAEQWHETVRALNHDFGHSPVTLSKRTSLLAQVSIMPLTIARAGCSRVEVFHRMVSHS